MRNFKWHGIPVNLPNTNKEWAFFSLVTIFSLIVSIFSIIFSTIDTAK
ncbi:MAG: hypothetical protein VX523_02475 [Chloroflexota bacterium]|nr:hypothetical protein [Chloroflexota bacterium]